MAKFNLNSNLENEFFKETFKFCKSCGCQTNQRAKFCIECGSKEFFDSLVEYKLNKELYCVKCLSKKEKNSDKCEYCGHNEFLNGNLAYFEMSRKYIDELNNKSVVLESDVINLRNESLDIDSKIKKTQTNLKKNNKEIINLSSDDSSDYIDKINCLNQEIDKYDNLINEQKEINKSMLEMVSNQQAKKENEEKAYNELETNYLLLIDEVDELEKEINILQQEKDNYKFRIELINNSKGKNKKIYNLEQYSYQNNEIDNLPDDPRVLFKLGQTILDSDDIDMEKYLRANLKGYYQLMNNISSRSGKSSGLDYYVLGLLYDGEYSYTLKNYLNDDKDRTLSYYESALNLGVIEARKKIEDIKKNRY